MELGKFDVAIVGAGPAGSTSAYLLAKAGFKVLFIDRGRGGNKLVWGGKAYAQPIRDVWPELDKEAPIHRWVTKERISFVHGDRALTLEYKLGQRVAFTTYLPELAGWMIRKAEAAGAVYIDEVVVDEIVFDGNRVIGIRSGSDVIRADVIIDAEGANRLLLEKAGLVDRPNPFDMALGVKEVLSIDPKVMEERFGLDRGEGLSWLVVGDITRGIPGGGFIYTMRDTISVGIVINIGHASVAAEKGLLSEHVSRLVDDLRTHPYFMKYWREADVAEYGARMTIEGGIRFMPKRLAVGGLLVVGDAAGMLVNTGYTIRGVDTAVTSGRLAAEAIIEAHNKGGLTEENLAIYEEKVKRSYVYKELSSHTGILEIFDDAELFSKLPALMTRVGSKIFEPEYEEPTVLEALRQAAKEEEISLLKFLIKAGKVVRKL